MYYLLICVAAFLFSIQFLLNDEYGKECGNTWAAALKFSLYTSISGFVALFCINKFKLEITAFSAVAALVYGAVSVALVYSSIKAFIYANLSVYSVFAMIGGMILPFMYGVLCGEKLTLMKGICCFLIAVSVFASINKGESSKKAIKYYIAVFILNGMVGVISEFHQSNASLCVDSGSFMCLTMIASALISLVLILLTKEKSFAITKKASVCAILYSVITSVGNLLLLISLLHLNASVQYPIVTGGTIVFSALISVARKQKLTKREWIGAAVACVSTIFMAL